MTTPLAPATDVLTRLETAWNAGDGAGYAAPFTPDATFVNIRGTFARGPQAIAAGHQQIFDTIYAGSRVRYDLAAVRELADGLLHAVVEATLEVPAGPLAGRLEAMATVLLARGDGDWQVAAFHNTQVAR